MADGPVTIPALLARAARDFAARPAIVDGPTSYTYAELADAAAAWGAGLVASGAEAGDRVAIWAPNSVQWVVAFLGLELAGATLVPINTRFKGREAADLVGRSHARVLVTTTDFLGTDYLGMLRGVDQELPDLQTVVVIAGAVPSGATAWRDFVGRATPDTRSELATRTADVSEHDVSDILFTSGTTGAPKGVVQTHGRTVRIGTDWVAMTGLSADDRYLMVNPYFHMFGLKAGILASIAAGATMLPEPVFDAERTLKRVQDEGVTVLPGAPTIYQALLDHPERPSYDLSSLRVAVTGAADIPVELIRRVVHELPFTVVRTGYGLTEGGTATGTGPDDDVETIATTVGKARPGFELRVVDGSGADVAPGDTGEVLLRGATVMSHYLDDPVATAEAMSTDGWLRTGDLGTIDAHGNLRIVGRAKDMFIVGGFNAYPAEIENALLRHPAVQRVAVIGIPDDRLGEVGMAFVVRDPTVYVTQDDLLTWARGEMANYKAPRRVVFVDDLPVNATGKVEKTMLREQATALLESSS
jgi:acyl-CoA synthetase (AMP-forming)/AMP-acid ligase II